MGVALVAAHRGGRGGRNANLTAHARRIVQSGALGGLALGYSEADGVTPIRVAGRMLAAAGRIAPGPVEVSIAAQAVALERTAPKGATSVRNRLPARVTSIEEASPGVLRVRLQSGALRLESLIVKAAQRDLRLRPGSRVYATIKAVNVTAVPRREG